MTGERAPSGPGPGAGPGAGSGAGPGADLAAFEKEARAFLDARLPPRPARTPTDRVALLEEIDPEREAETLRAAKLWQAALYDAGYAELEGNGPRRSPRSSTPTTCPTCNRCSSACTSSRPPSGRTGPTTSSAAASARCCAAR
ncbi:hypothetical protein ACFQHO_40665 [Actinomadura yumaensis]|uniref:hypothetical protein n=1 Tax=Actinomadura yumaensis TaxID=111807 RepID=UPI00361BE182